MKIAYLWEGTTIRKLDENGREILKSDLDTKPEFPAGSRLAKIHQDIIDKRKGKNHGRI